MPKRPAPLPSIDCRRASTLTGAISSPGEPGVFQRSDSDASNMFVRGRIEPGIAIAVPVFGGMDHRDDSVCVDEQRCPLFCFIRDWRHGAQRCSNQRQYSPGVARSRRRYSWPASAPQRDRYRRRRSRFRCAAADTEHNSDARGITTPSNRVTCASNVCPRPASKGCANSHVFSLTTIPRDSCVLSPRRHVPVGLRPVVAVTSSGS